MILSVVTDAEGCEAGRARGGLDLSFASSGLWEDMAVASVVPQPTDLYQTLKV